MSQDQQQCPILLIGGSAHGLTVWPSSPSSSVYMPEEWEPVMVSPKDLRENPDILTANRDPATLYIVQIFCMNGRAHFIGSLGPDKPSEDLVASTIAESPDFEAHGIALSH